MPFRIYKEATGDILVESPTKQREMLIITSTVKVKEQAPNHVVSSIEAYGLVGILELAWGRYLLAVTSRDLAANIQNHKVWRVTSGMAIPLGNTQYPMLPNELDQKTLAKYSIDIEMLQQVESIINSGRVYYSTTYDLTHSLQHNFLMQKQSFAAKIDDRYFFNSHLSSFLNNVENAKPWVLKTIYGFAGMISIGAQDSSCGTVLVSRTSSIRLGARYVRRGLDEKGNAANNVEMEQIVFDNDVVQKRTVSSFCQVRGSMPSIWGQEIDLSYRPKLHIADTSKPRVWNSTKMHYDDLLLQYSAEDAFSTCGVQGSVVCVNLLDVEGFEKPLSDIYEEGVKKYNNSRLNYESFPVSKWCKNMDFTKMDILLNRMTLRLLNSGWFVGEGNIPSFSSVNDFECLRLQTGLARVSCLDSLDRTNLTCSMFARYVVPYQIEAVIKKKLHLTLHDGVSDSSSRDPASETRSLLVKSMSAFTNLWADSGDAISINYAGTGALKSDVTRTGKRLVFKGSINDGLNSLTRYYLNNFMDGKKQDAYDLWTGKTEQEKLAALISTSGNEKAERLKKPLLHHEKGVGFFVPAYAFPLIETFDDFSRRKVAKKPSSGHINQQGQAETYLGLTVEVAKSYSPATITSVFDFVVAMCVCIYMMLVSKALKIQGKILVNMPQLTVEYEKLPDIDKDS